MGALQVDTRREADRAVLSLSGELDLATVETLRTAAVGALAEPGCSALILDLAGLTFVDSTGIGSWIELRSQADASGASLELAAVPPATARTLRIAGLAGLFGLDS